METHDMMDLAAVKETGKSEFDEEDYLYNLPSMV